MNEKPTRLLFVCLGNIVRSPLAENLFIHLAREAGKGHRYAVDSAGTGAWHVGESPDSRMRRVAADRGFEYDGAARQVRREDFEAFDWIIAMDHSNFANLVSMTRDPDAKAKVRMMREFDPQGGRDDVVPDPYYGGLDGFERVYDIVERSCRGLLDALENGRMK